LFDLDLEGYREDSSYEDDESESYRIFEGELIGHGLDDVDRYEYLESEEDRATYLFTDMSIDVFSCIVPVCPYGTIESHEYTTEYDTHSEYLDSIFHDDESIVVVHISKKS